MQLQHRITIDLLEFIQSAKFDYIKLGQTKEWILNNFPDPDGLQDSAEVYDNPIWWYGNIELHFNGQEVF